MDSFVDAMTEAVLRLDAGGRIALANRAFSRMIGTEMELEGKTTLDIFRNPELEASIKSVLAGDPPANCGDCSQSGTARRSTYCRNTEPGQVPWIQQ